MKHVSMQKFCLYHIIDIPSPLAPRMGQNSQRAPAQLKKFTYAHACSRSIQIRSAVEGPQYMHTNSTTLPFMYTQLLRILLFLSKLSFANDIRLIHLGLNICKFIYTYTYCHHSCRQQMGQGQLGQHNIFQILLPPLQNQNQYVNVHTLTCKYFYEYSIINMIKVCWVRFCVYCIYCTYCTQVFNVEPGTLCRLFFNQLFVAKDVAFSLGRLMFNFPTSILLFFPFDTHADELFACILRSC
eukprot:TRINITY_DN3588_c1_g1_i10.p3 TRINITY_DN3588_c1_g1~~TRINITY_DN3588_c1_g1_i10.p3  ORF type:complete len:241 (+),score=-12.63 TRINITY_DN3588_c1_g1_i10:1139-1861(+)